MRVAWIALCSGSTKIFYDRLSNCYEEIFLDHIVHIETVVTLLTSIYYGRNNCTILDLGCGTGMVSKALTKHGFRVIGIDISLESIRLLKRTNQEVALIQGNIEYLPLQDRCFQTLVCLGTWRHLKNSEVALDEICRVLCKDGNFVVGYFPPKLGGLIYIPNNPWGKMVVWFYNRTVCWLGYDDLIDFDHKGKILQTIRKRFEQVRKIDTGQNWHTILASRPYARFNSI